MMPAKAAKPCVTPSWQLNPQKPLFHNISRCRYALLLGQCGSDGGKPLGPPSAIATLKPDRLSQVRIARRVCRSSSTTRMRRHDGLLRRVKRAPRHNREHTTGNAQPRTHLPSAQPKALPFCLANQCAIHISDANRAICLPSTVYKDDRTTLCNRVGKFC